ncbi:MAG: hemolysin III family protein [Neisseriaceae bacterium]|jgi:hemolysin III|nr:Hemolysin family protein [Pseudomonadota bacterium]RTK97840.1 MAG: hemolysin III family protein [Neisseriaceae bacterium]
MYHGERLNSFTHLIGVGLSVTGLVLLLNVANAQADIWKLISFSVYGSMLVLLYLSSTLYHSVRGRAKLWLQKLDHAAIYLLIAGTYTPFTLVTLHGPWGWWIFGINWGLAVLGIVQEFVLGKRTRALSMFIYLAMGWMVLVAIKPLLAVLPLAGFWWLGAGGLFYTVGIIFYLLDERMRHAHGIWHLFVLAGSACQYWCVLNYVA